MDIINDTTKDKNITVSSLWNRILKIWDTLFELIQIETQYNKNYLTFFCKVKLELWKGVLTRTRKATPKINKNILKIIFRDIWSVNNPIQTTAVFKHVVILYYTGPDVFTLKVATYLKRKIHFFSAALFTGISEMCSESSQTSKMELFAKIVNG